LEFGLEWPPTQPHTPHHQPRRRPPARPRLSEPAPGPQGLHARGLV